MSQDDTGRNVKTAKQMFDLNEILTVRLNVKNVYETLSKMVFMSYAVIVISMCNVLPIFRSNYGGRFF